MPTTLIEYRLLGPIEVRVDGQVLDIGGLKQRALLAMLLLRANEPVSRDVLAEQLWGDHPPGGAPHTIEVYVSRLRKALAAAAGRPLVATRSAAYSLQVAPDELDVHRAERLAREGRHELAAGAPGAAAVKFGEALALWRGEALADLRYEPFFQAQISWLEEFRVGVAEDRIGADLALGRQAGLIRELEPLVAAYPLRERLTGQLMVALCRCGRRGEALAAYDRARAVLAGELGLDPGPELRDLHARILVDDPSVTTAPAVGAPARAGNGRAGPGDLAAGRDGAPGRAGATRGLPEVPRQLPAGGGYFAGRAAELKELDAILGQNAETSASVVIAAIGGMAGAGKTALAVQWARQIARRFPDGQLYVNLRGYDPDVTPVLPDEVTSWFLAALGVPAAQIPVSAPARAGLYRSVLAERRVLIVHAERLTDAGALSDWLRAEHLVLMGAIAQASAIGAARRAWQIYPLLGALLAQDGHWADSEASGQIALDAATEAADYEGLGRVHRSLAMRSEILGARAQAHHHNLKSLEYGQLAGDPLGQAHAHVSIAQSILLRYRGITVPSGPPGDDADQGLRHAEQAAVLFRQVGDAHGEGLALTAQASFHCRPGGYSRARGLCWQALDLQRKAGSRQGQAHAWHVLADAHHGLGDYAEAARCYQQALEVPVDFGPRRHWYRALVLTHLGDSRRAAGDAAAAREAWQRALRILDDLDHPHAASLRARLKSP